MRFNHSKATVRTVTGGLFSSWEQLGVGTAAGQFDRWAATAIALPDGRRCRCGATAAAPRWLGRLPAAPN